LGGTDVATSLNHEQEALALQLAAHAYEGAVHTLATSGGSLRARIADAYANKASVAHDVICALPSDVAADMSSLSGLLALGPVTIPAWGGGISEEDVADSIGSYDAHRLHAIADLMCTISTKLQRADSAMDYQPAEHSPAAR